ncbi:MAG: hypothetical protein Q9187_006509 [Circinaria calcarea]
MAKKVPAQENTEPKRFRDRLFWKNNKAQGKDGKHGLVEVMWLRDLLVPQFQNAHIATSRTGKTAGHSFMPSITVSISTFAAQSQALYSLARHSKEAVQRYTGSG